MLGERLFAARTDKTLRLSAGDRVWLACDPGRLYWFDGATGERIAAA